MATDTSGRLMFMAHVSQYLGIVVIRDRPDDKRTLAWTEHYVASAMRAYYNYDPPPPYSDCNNDLYTGRYFVVTQ